MDADDVAAHASVWWAEALGALVALVAAAVAAGRGDYFFLLVAVALGAYAVDRVRIRLDNRSLARAVENVREGEETD